MAPPQVIRAALVAARHRLDELLVRFELTLADPTSAATATEFAALARGLRSHLRREDEVTLVALAVEAGGPAIEAVRREHAPLRALLAEIERGLRHRHGAGTLGNTWELATALTLHHRGVEALVRAEPAAPGR